MKLYMIRTVPLSIIRSFSLYTQQCYMSYRFADSCSQFQSTACEQAVGWTCTTYAWCYVYSFGLLMIDGKTVRSM